MKQKILIVDDDPSERAALRGLLESEGRFEIKEAADGQQALDQLADGLNPDLCIFDLRMPGIDGVELLKRVRRDPDLGDLKIVVASSTRDKGVIVELAQLRISAYILKPFDPARTIATVQKVLPRPEKFNPVNASRNLLAKTLLVADDDDTVRGAIAAVARKGQEWEVVEAKDGQEAIDRLHGGLWPDLCIVDMRMPNIDGPEFIRRVREEASLSRLKIVVISGETDRDKIRGLADLRIAGFLLKPVTMDKITALLKTGAIEAAD